MTTAEWKSFDKPDETREFPNGRADILEIGGSQIGQLTLEPGWRWSEHVKPVAGTAWCEAPHFQYHVAGTLRIQMSDGTQFDATPGDVTAAAGPRRLGRGGHAGCCRRLVGCQQLREVRLVSTKR